MKQGLFNQLERGDIVIYDDNHVITSLRGAPAVFIGKTIYREGRFKGLRRISSYPKGMTSPPSCLQNVIYRNGRKII